VIGEMIISLLPLIIVISLIVQIILGIILFRKYQQKLALIFTFIVSIFLTSLFIPQVYDYYYPVTKNYEKTDNSQVVSVLSANILYTNGDMVGLAGKIKQLSPDVVFLCELTRAHYSELIELLHSEYHFSYAPTSAMNGYFAKSRPVSVSEIKFPQDQSYLELEFIINGTKYEIFGVHAPPMDPDSAAVKTSYLTNLESQIKSLSSSKELVVGDFNLSPWVKRYSDFVDNLPRGFTNLGEGNGYYATWEPAANLGLFVTAIDHAFISPSLKINDFEVVEMSGSDHKGIFIQMR
jgi:endonuclease/exonuclease/phosphatase (EEP) superfamily protein YafD